MKWYRIHTSMYYVYITREEYQEYSAISRKDAILLLVADLKFGYLPAEGDALAAAKASIEENLGVNWTVEDFLKSGLEIWESNDMPCYIAHKIEELSSAKI